jgi:phosphate transport system substrate-binding protein
VIKKVKQYHNEKGAIGYSFRYFLEGLNQEEGVKILSVDGVYPTVESIEDGSYPILADLVVSKLKDNDKENVDKVIEFMLSDDGQEIIRKTGYGGLKQN